MKLNEITGHVVNCSVKIHSALGPGLLESVYQRILAYELRKAKLGVETEVDIPVPWDGHLIDQGFRADLIVSSQVLVELKSVETLLPVHHKQTLTYLKLADLPVGLLINFGAAYLRDGIHRIAHKVEEEE